MTSLDTERRLDRRALYNNVLELESSQSPARSHFTRKWDPLLILNNRPELITRGDQVIVTDLVFHRDGQPVGDIRKAWAAACIKAGLYHVEKDADGNEDKIPDKLFHDFRRTAVRNLVRSGVDPTTARSITGHRTAAVFERYNIIDENDVRRAMQQRAVYEGSLPVKKQNA